MTVFVPTQTIFNVGGTFRETFNVVRAEANKFEKSDFCDSELPRKSKFGMVGS